jgi:hypothetical protein
MGEGANGRERKGMKDTPLEQGSVRNSPRKRVVGGPESSQYVGQLNQGVNHFYLEWAFFHSFRVQMRGFHDLLWEKPLPCSRCQN